jgi:hypothetical protein
LRFFRFPESRTTFPDYFIYLKRVQFARHCKVTNQLLWVKHHCRHLLLGQNNISNIPNTLWRHTLRPWATLAFSMSRTTFPDYFIYLKRGRFARHCKVTNQLLWVKHHCRNLLLGQNNISNIPNTLLRHI